MRVVRFSGVGLLTIYFLLHLLSPSDWSELFVYNLIPITAIIGIALAPHISDGVAKPSVAIAIVFGHLVLALLVRRSFFHSQLFQTASLISCTYSFTRLQSLDYPDFWRQAANSLLSNLLIPQYLDWV